jgi:PTH1 family peptidyl-tRNA hydrolase
LKAIIGLGNPGVRYNNTRHNIGFMILDAFADKHNLSFTPDKGEYYSVGSSLLEASHFYLCKPTTFINLSGNAVSHIIETKNIDLDDLLVITDDINLPTGSLRFRQAGGDGGHNGLSSIIYSLETSQFNRLRFGVGSEFEDGEMPNYVLDKFYEKEKEIIRLGVGFSVELIEKFIIGGRKEMMNFYSSEIININEKINIART